MCLHPMHDDADALRSRRQRVCRWLLRIHRLQDATFSKRLPEDIVRALSLSAYQEMLLDIYLAQLEDRDIYQSLLATPEPPAAVHRQAARLEKLGAISRSSDTGDLRRQNVTLSPALQAVFDDFVDSVEAAICRQFPM